MKVGRLVTTAAIVWALSLGLVVTAKGKEERERPAPTPVLDAALAAVLSSHGFTGRVESTLEARLGRRIDKRVAELGRLLWFDNAHSLHQDNTCGGCHSPSNGFGDTQSIAIGVDNNGLVGPNRKGPRNQRRSPMVINSVFYPRLMWNGRFFANTLNPADLGDPFSNMFGFTFPAPEGQALGYFDHLLQAQAFIPPTELVEVAGFTGTADPANPSPFDIFDNGKGLPVPAPDSSGFRNDPIRAKALGILNDTPGYRLAFLKAFPDLKRGDPITFDHFGRAIAEFEFTLTFADAPIDQFARGDRAAMTPAEKRGALVFFGAGKCITCHATRGRSNEMFSDFENHVAGVPQLAPPFGALTSNMIYDGGGANEDFGAMQISGLDADKYKFRTSPLRNIGVSPAFFHNGAFTDLEAAIRYHLNPAVHGPRYNPAAAGVAPDLRGPRGPIRPVLARLHPIFKAGIALTDAEIKDLTQFVKTGLLDRRATPEQLCKLVPRVVPSGLPVLTFEGCAAKKTSD